LPRLRCWLECETLPDDRKSDILRGWYHDAGEIAVAEEKGMPACDTDLVHEILLSLQQLEAIDVDNVGPSKQHGLAMPVREAVTSPSNA
jgi:hypothetical protein